MNTPLWKVTYRVQPHGDAHPWQTTLRFLEGDAEAAKRRGRRILKKHFPGSLRIVARRAVRDHKAEESKWNPTKETR